MRAQVVGLGGGVSQVRMTYLALGQNFNSFPEEADKRIQ
jgi:hypothetical protein